MFSFRDPLIYQANGKTHGRVSSGLKPLEAPVVQKEGLRRDGMLVVCVVSALSLALATTSVVLSVVVMGNSVLVDEPGQRSVMRICIPCYEVRGSTPNESDLEVLKRLFQSWKNKWNEGIRREEEKNEEDEEEICCADDANQLATLLNKILDEKAEEAAEAIDQQKGSASDYPPCGLTSLLPANGTACLLPASLSLNPIKVAAHLAASRISSSRSAASAGTSEGLALSKWDLNSRRSFCRGLGCNVTHLVPVLPGIYFIYSQVSFAFPSTMDESFTHYIKRFNTRYPNGGVDLLMQHSSNIRGSTPPSASSSSHSTTDSSFLGGLVRVHPNDQLFVEVSHQRYLRSTQTATFFGLFEV